MANGFLPKGADEKFCSECGSVIKAKAEICPKCGVRQSTPQSMGSFAIAPNGKSQVAAGLPAILLGGIGVHHFYLRRPGLGIVYLLFFWTWIPAILGLIEGIVYLTMPPEQFVRKYGYR